MIKRIAAMIAARNLEFLRDRPTLTWNIVTPLVLVFGLSFIFSNDNSDQFVVGVEDAGVAVETATHPFFDTHFVDFVPVSDRDDALNKVARHQLDMFVVPGQPLQYWTNPESPSGYIVERLLLQTDPTARRNVIEGTAIRYVDWLLPGVLGMNMMFSCLFGVGYVVVRYRKNGFLKRLQATPLRAVEFIAAQAISRLLLTLTISAAVFAGIAVTLDILMTGSYLALMLDAAIGGATLISMSLLVAARVTSEELAGGLLNLLSWPMMLLSGVFFSLESSPQWLQTVAAVLPLTQILNAARAVMIDGAGVADIASELAILATTAVLFVALGSIMFKWRSV